MYTPQSINKTLWNFPIDQIPFSYSIRTTKFWTSKSERKWVVSIMGYTAISTFWSVFSDHFFHVWHYYQLKFVWCCVFICVLKANARNRYCTFAIWRFYEITRSPPVSDNAMSHYLSKCFVVVAKSHKQQYNAFSIVWKYVTSSTKCSDTYACGNCSFGRILQSKIRIPLIFQIKGGFRVLMDKKFELSFILQSEFKKYMHLVRALTENLENPM